MIDEVQSRDEDSPSRTLRLGLTGESLVCRNLDSVWCLRSLAWTNDLIHRNQVKGELLASWPIRRKFGLLGGPRASEAPSASRKSCIAPAIAYILS